MTQMSMNKAIHGAFRRDLDRFIAALGAFQPGDVARAQQLNKTWVNFDDQLTFHHEGEHAIAWPALETIGVSKDVLATMDAEHEKMGEVLTRTRAAMSTFTRTAGADESREAMAAFEDLKAVTVQHLEHEESELEDLYLSKRDTPEMKAMGKAFGKVSPSRGGQFFAWLLDGATPDEKQAVTREVPGPVVTIIGGIFGRSYRKNIAPVWSS